MALEPKILTIADLKRMDEEDEARMRLLKDVFSGCIQIELEHEAS